MAILAIAILVIGPKRLVTVAQALGRVIRRMQAISSEFVGNLQAELAETEKETREALGGMAGESAEVSAEIKGTERAAKSGYMKGLSLFFLLSPCISLPTRNHRAYRFLPLSSALCLLESLMIY